MSTWILVANSSTARIYSQDRQGGALKAVHQFEHPESRSKGSELVSDRPGHYQGAGDGHGSYVQAMDPKEVESERFARELSGALDDGRNKKEFEKLVIVAPPHFHGLLNKSLDHQVQKLIVGSVEKDYTHEDERALLAHLQLN